MAEPTFTVAGTEGAPTTGAPAAEAQATTGDVPVTGSQGEKTAEQTKADDAAKAAADEGQAKIDADKKAADEQASAEAAKALLFADIKDLKLPDGTVSDEGLVKEFTELMKDGKLTKEQAQKAADLHLKSVSVFAQKLQADAQATVKVWGEEITNDKELGGAKIQETIATAEKYFALAEKVPGVNVNRLKADMVRTGMANHPDVIRMSRFIGQHLGEDNMFISDRSTGGGPPLSDAEVLYPNSK